MVVRNSFRRILQTALLILISLSGVFHATSSNARAQSPSIPATGGKEALVRLSGYVPALQIAKSTPLGRMATNDRVDFAVVLPLRNQAELESLIDHLHDPSAPEYGHYLSPKEFQDQFGPTQADYNIIMKYGRSHGLKITAKHANRTLLMSPDLRAP